MNFPFALWLIGLETGMGTIPAFCKRNIFSSTSGKGFLAQKKKKKILLLLQDVVVFCP